MRSITILIAILIIFSSCNTYGKSSDEDRMKTIKNKAISITDSFIKNNWTNSVFPEIRYEALYCIGWTGDTKKESFLNQLLQEPGINYLAMTALLFINKLNYIKYISNYINISKNENEKMTFTFLLLQNNYTNVYNTCYAYSLSKNPQILLNVAKNILLIYRFNEIVYDQQKLYYMYDNIIENKAISENPDFYEDYLKILRIGAILKRDSIINPVSLLFKQANSDMYYSGLSIAEKYLFYTNNTTFFNVFEEVFTNYKDKILQDIVTYNAYLGVLIQKENKQQYINEALTIISTNKNEIENKMIMYTLAKTGNMKIINQLTNNYEDWNILLDQIANFEIYNAKDILVNYFKNGFPESFQIKNNDFLIAKNLFYVNGTLFSLIKNASPNIYRDICDLLFLLDYNKLPESLNNYIRMDAAYNIMLLIHLYENGNISEERFWGKVQK